MWPTGLGSSEDRLEARREQERNKRAAEADALAEQARLEHEKRLARRTTTHAHQRRVAVPEGDEAFPIFKDRRPGEDNVSMLSCCACAYACICVHACVSVMCLCMLFRLCWRKLQCLLFSAEHSLESMRFLRGHAKPPPPPRGAMSTCHLRAAWYVSF